VDDLDDATSFENDLNACEILVRSGDLPNAKQRLPLIERLTPTNEEEWQRLHKLCIDLGDRTRAQVFTERFLKVDASNAMAHIACARNFLPIYSEHDRVKQCLTTALGNPRHDFAFWKEVAIIQNAVADHVGACESARKALEMCPFDTNLRELRIFSLIALGRSKEVREECGKVARWYTASTVADPVQLARLARTAAEARVHKLAKVYIGLALGYMPTVNCAADVELVRAMLLTRQARRAIPHLNNLLMENSQNLWLWQTLLETAMSVRSYDIALIVIRQIKSLPYVDPEYAWRLRVMEKTASRSWRNTFGRALIRWRSSLTFSMNRIRK
jgi:tetratricopeptide (TPR) repeat protein